MNTERQLQNTEIQLLELGKQLETGKKENPEGRKREKAMGNDKRTLRK